MATVYLDTSALVRHAEAAGPSPTPRNLNAGSAVRSLLLDPSSSVAISEVGLLEYHDVVTTLWRDTQPVNAVYDASWCDSAIATVMDALGNGRIEVLPQGPKVFEQAMVQVTLATRDHSKKFKVWDAVHLITAVGWSMDLGEPVELWTSDGDFASFTALYPHFNEHVVINDLNQSPSVS